MGKYLNKVFSSLTSMISLFLLILVVAIATFIEDHYDTATSKLLIYDAKWFEFLMLAIVVLYIGKMFNSMLFRKDKLPQLIFHFSFLFLFIGGGITRYFGFEANMHVLENESVNVLYTAEPYFQIRTSDKDIEYSSDFPLYFTQIGNNSFHLDFEIKSGEGLEIDYHDYIFNAEEVLSEGINEANNGKFEWVAGSSDKKSPDALIVIVTYKGKRHEAVLFYDDTRYTQPFKRFNFDDLQLDLTYGPKPIDLPFALKLDNFILTKYPGTDIPSTSESNIVLIDKRYNISEEHNIAKNKVLDYDGYRFFQTSYDDDEKGTILSVNYDYYGTRITYFGYFLMIVGAIMILILKKSRFSQLNKKIEEVRQKRKALLMTIILFVGTSSLGFSQNNIQNPISSEHADSFGHLMVQTYDGRFSSVHSLAIDVIHKISGKDNFDIRGKGNLDPMRLFLDIHVDPDFWKSQELIIVREQSVRNLLGVKGKYAAYSNFFNNNMQYKLDDFVKRAFKKKASEQSSFDREVIKVNDRLNVFAMTLNGTALKLFPEQNSINNNWVSWNEEQSFTQLSGDLLPLNEELKLNDFSYSNIMRTYLVSTIYARESNDYTIPDKIIGHISEIQRQLTPSELLPSKSKIDIEVFYNKSRFFDLLKYIYAVLGISLLILSFIENFKVRPDKMIYLSIKILIGLILSAFVYQTLGMGLRWYLGGHAPWSNGYEVLLLVAWGSVLAGIYVIKYSKITLASTALLASLVLMTASHSYYDPQLTNLNPVLKSYWLIIHVAIITVGYGFLALSFILGLINILLYILKTEKKQIHSLLIIKELTYINEKLITIGMLLTAIGTFIGCIWANESWGTYWDWNAKQTWSLIIIFVYAVILHFRYIKGIRYFLAFNIGALISFGSVLMTFVGVNYYFTKGIHSYATDDPPIFPIWAWISIFTLICLIGSVIIKENYWRRKYTPEEIDLE